MTFSIGAGMAPGGFTSQAFGGAAPGAPPLQVRLPPVPPHPLARPAPSPAPSPLAWARSLTPAQRTTQDARLDALANPNARQTARDVALDKIMPKPAPAKPWVPGPAANATAGTVTNAPLPKGSTVTSPQLSPSQLQLWRELMPQASQWAGENISIDPNRQLVAPFTPAQQAGQADVLSAVPGMRNIAGEGSSALSFLTDPNAINSLSNPLLASSINAATRPITQQLTEATLPQLESGAAAAGQYGSSREGIAQGLAGQAASQAVGDTAAKISEAAYQSNLDAMTKAMGLAPSIQQMQLAPGVAESGVGEVQQQLQQQQDQANLARDLYNMNIPLTKAEDLANISAGQGTGSQTTASAAPVSWLQALLGGASTGASIGSGLGSVAGIPGAAVGGAAGGGLGVLLSMLQ